MPMTTRLADGEELETEEDGFTADRASRNYPPGMASLQRVFSWAAEPAAQKGADVVLARRLVKESGLQARSPFRLRFIEALHVAPTTRSAQILQTTVSKRRGRRFHYILVLRHHGHRTVQRLVIWEEPFNRVGLARCQVPGRYGCAVFQALPRVDRHHPRVVREGLIL